MPGLPPYAGQLVEGGLLLTSPWRIHGDRTSKAPRGFYVKAEGAPDPAHVVSEAAPHSVSMYMSVPETREDLSASDLHRQKRQNAKSAHERKKVVRAVGRGS